MARLYRGGCVLRRRLSGWLLTPAAWIFMAGARMAIPRLSRAAVWKLGAMLGGLAMGLDRAGRRVAEANLSLVYGDRLSMRRRRALVRASYRHVARMVLDAFWFSRNRVSRLHRWTHLPSDVAHHFREESPGVVVTGHLGNWEIAPHILAMAGVGLTSVAKPLGDPLTTRTVNRMRAATGQRIVPVNGAMRGLVRAIRNGDWAVLLIDQHTPPQDGGICVDFLGVPAYVSGAAAFLGRRMQAPVFIAYCRANAAGKYVLTLAGRVRCTGDEEVDELTQRCISVLTGEIRRHPGQWLWMYKRWKRIPPGCAKAVFPFYARPMRVSGALEGTYAG